MNGFWLDGTGFRRGTFYMVEGTLRTQKPARVDSTLDLAGGYVVPPYGEAHTHRPSLPDRFEEDSSFFLKDGVFYVMNFGNLARYSAEFSELSKRPETIDGKFANALLASPQSHGVELWRRLVGRGLFPGVVPDSLDGDAYFVLSAETKAEQHWSEILATRPDFIKIMIEYSEEYDLRKEDPEFFGKSGLDPALIPGIVSRAREAGLRVAAHIETAADFRVAVEAKVDVVGHLPGYNIPAGDDLARYRIDPRVAEQAAEQGTIVVTTTILSVGMAEGEQERLKRIQATQVQNLRVLAGAGVALAAGSDQYSENSVDEVLHLASLGVFDKATLVRMLCSVTPRAIFPERRVGVLEDGWEASFLVLGGNPLEQLESLREIRLRVKEGHLLAVE